MILPAAYIPGSIALDFLPKSWDKKRMIFLGIIFAIVSLFVVGPTSLIYIPETSILKVMIVG